MAADTERRPQRAWEAPTHQSAPPGLVTERRRPRHGPPGGKGSEAPAKSDGETGPRAQRQRSPTRVSNQAPRGSRAKSPPGRARGPTARGLQHKGGPVAPPDADAARPPQRTLGANPRRGPSGPATRSSHATGPWNALPHARRPTNRAPPTPAGPPTRAAGAPFSLLPPLPSLTREWGRQHSARDPAPQEPQRPKGGAGTRQTARPGLGPDTVTGGGRGEEADARSVVQAEAGWEPKAAQNGRWAGGCGEGARTKRGPDSACAEEGTGSGKGAPTETRAGPPGKHARDPTATSTRAVPRRPRRQPASAPLASLPTSQAPPTTHGAGVRTHGTPAAGARLQPPSVRSIPEPRPREAPPKARRGPDPRPRATRQRQSPEREAGGRQPPLARRKGGRGAQGRPKPLGTHTATGEAGGRRARARALAHHTPEAHGPRHRTPARPGGTLPRLRGGRRRPR